MCVQKHKNVIRNVKGKIHLVRNAAVTRTLGRQDSSAKMSIKKRIYIKLAFYEWLDAIIVSCGTPLNFSITHVSTLRF